MKRSLKIGLACTLSIIICALGIALIIVILTKSKQSKIEPVKSNRQVWGINGEVSNRSVRCDNDPLGIEGATYLTGRGIIRHYPDQEIAKNYDKIWHTAMYIDCNGFEVGPDCSMEECHISVSCLNDKREGATYRYRNNPSGLLFDMWWNSNNAPPQGITFYEGLVGDDTSSVTTYTTFGNNASYKVDSEEMKQLFKNTVRLATSANILKNIVVVNMWVAFSVDDTNYRGINYRIQTGTPGTSNDFKNRKSFKIEDGIKTNSITALVILSSQPGILEYYPSLEIASHWDPDWDKAKNIDCTNHTFGRDLELENQVPAYNTLHVDSYKHSSTERRGQPYKPQDTGAFPPIPWS